MATKTVNQTAGPTEADQEVRRMLALEASWEIEGIAQLVHDQLDGSAEYLPLRSMLRRTKELSSVIMSALGDDGEPVKDIRERLEA